MNNENGKSKKVDLGMTVPHQRPGKEKGADNFSDDFAPPQLAEQSRIADWSMPEPIFRVSEGESLEEVAKRTTVFDLKDIEDFGKTTPNFNFSEVSPPEPFNQTVPNLNIQPQPDISEPSHANEIVVVNKLPAHSSNYKVFFIVGLFSILLFASVVLFGIYFLFLNNPW